MNIKELFKSKRVGHIALEVRVRYQSIKSNKDLISDKVIVLLLHYILSGHICHCLGHILLIVHPMTIIVCTYNHTLFHIQIMVHYNNRLLAIVIWLKMRHVLLLNSVRRP